MITRRWVWRPRRLGELVAAPGEVPFGEDKRAVRVKIGLYSGVYGMFALVLSAHRAASRG